MGETAIAHDQVAAALEIAADRACAAILVVARQRDQHMAHRSVWLDNLALDVRAIVLAVADELDPGDENGPPPEAERRAEPAFHEGGHHGTQERTAEA
jgi:hypothetical protein